MDLIRRLFAVLRILWLRWRNPPPTLEELQREREARLRRIDQELKAALAEFDAELEPITTRQEVKQAWAVLSQAQRAIERADLIVSGQPYVDRWADHVRVYADGTRTPIPGDRQF